MKITSATIQPQFNLYKPPSVQTFKGIHTLTHTNLGNCAEGFIGNIKVRKGSGEDTFLKVFKKNIITNTENYSVKNIKDELIGEITFCINKYHNNAASWAGDPSHVFVTELRNYSNPNTPYYRNLEYYKDIGTRLLQIAQKRSNESLCNGNIALISKNESKNWYKDVIGMTEEFLPDKQIGFIIHNPNKMILPQSSKERLAGLRGGL